MRDLSRRDCLGLFGVGAAAFCTGPAALAGEPAASPAASTLGKSQRPFVGIQVRKQSLENDAAGPLLDDLVKTVALNALVSISVDQPAELQAVHRAAEKRGVRYFPARFEWSGQPGSVNAAGDQVEKAFCPFDTENNDRRLKWFETTATALPDANAGVLCGFEERMTPLDTAMKGELSGCFCPKCLDRSRQLNIDAARARTGFQQIFALSQDCQKGQPPADGAFVTLMRTLVACPEVLAWERMWFDGLVAVRKNVRELIKSKRPKWELGWHIYHALTLSPFFRATYDYNSYIGLADWVKPSVYHDCGAARFRSQMNAFNKMLLADLTKQDALGFLSGTLRLEPSREPTLAEYGEKSVRPFSEEYVSREVKRGLAALKGRLPLYPGIGVDIPTAFGAKPLTPESTYEATKAVFEAGAQGVIICRHYDEMKRENVEAAGRAIKERL